MIIFAALAIALGAGPSLPHGAAAAEPASDARGGRVPVATIVARFRTPTFARQTKLSCAVCHLGGFPQLSRFGRLFKLNGYTLSELPPITEPPDSSSAHTLSLASIPGLSTMAVVSATAMGRALPGTPAVRAEFPQQFSLLFGGEISPRLGALAELSYSDVSGRFAVDNTDIRFASHAAVGARDLLYGATLHNNPTVQDVWNTLPAWSFPFTSSALAPRPAAGTLLDGALSQSVLGLGSYALFDNLLYVEGTAYVSAPQGPRTLVDSTTPNTIRDVAPYWRVALQNRRGPLYLMIGTYGMSAEINQPFSGGGWNHYVDVGVDAQAERQFGSSYLVGRASWTHEDQELGAMTIAHPRMAANAANQLSSLKLNASYGPVGSWSFSAGVFSTSGTTDRLLYAPGAITGSRTGDPRTQGEVAEVTLNRWLNSRLALQYVAYQRFNGGASSYDLATGGRAAQDNNALYVYLWIAY